MKNGYRRRCAANGVGFVLGSIAGIAALWLSGCNQVPNLSSSGYDTAQPYSASNHPIQGPGAESLGEMRRAPADDAKPAEERPGLATGFGKRVKDEWQKQSFVRDSSKPKGMDVIYYNDREGVEAMTGYKYKVESLQTAAGELVEWGIKGNFGYLPAYKSGQKRFAVGSGGSAYSILVKNRCRSHVEVVISVDGLDVIDGKAASFSKRGYVIAPGDTLEVKGWRTGWESVARFEFSDVGGSYANQRHGNARNVGVIGLAVFGEKGVDPWKWMPREVDTRATANPFAQAP